MSKITEDTEAFVNFYTRMPAHYDQNCLRRLDETLQQLTPTCICNNPQTGEYKPDMEGLYEVRLMQNQAMAKRWVERILKENNCVIVRVQYNSQHGKEVVTY